MIGALADAALILPLLGREAGGADHHRGAPLGGQLGMGDGRLRHREVDHHLRSLEDQLRRSRNKDAQLAKPGQLARVLADGGAVGRLGGRDQLCTRRLADLLDQHLTHPAGGADDADRDFSHVLLPLHAREPGPTSLVGRIGQGVSTVVPSVAVEYGRGISQWRAGPPERPGSYRVTGSVDKQLSQLQSNSLP